MGGVVSVACQGFLVREACVGVLVGGAGFLGVTSNGLWDIKGFGVASSCPYIEAQGCVLCCWRIFVVCLALELVGPWVELGFSVGMYGGI